MHFAMRGESRFVEEPTTQFLTRSGRATYGACMSLLSTTQLSVLSPPVSEPLSLSEAKSFLRIDNGDEDDVIVNAIKVARVTAETYLGIAILPQTLSYNLDYPDVEIITLPRGPVTSITSVVSIDENGNSTVWDASNYRVSSDGYSLLLKQTPCAAVLSIQYQASLASNTSTIPALLKQGMLHHLAVLVEARDGSVSMPAMAQQCYQPFRKVRI